MQSQSATAANELINEMQIDGTPTQLETIWRHRSRWDLVITQAGNIAEYSFKKEPDKIIVRFKQPIICKNDDWRGLDLNFDFKVYSRASREALDPLQKNGMKICTNTNSFTLGKNKIKIS